MCAAAHSGQACGDGGGVGESKHPFSRPRASNRAPPIVGRMVGIPPVEGEFGCQPNAPNRMQPTRLRRTRRGILESIQTVRTQVKGPFGLTFAADTPIQRASRDATDERLP